MMTVLKRLFFVPLGFILGTITTVVVLVSLGSERITHAMSGHDDVSIFATWELMQQAVILGSAATLIPAVLMVIIGEVARIRTVYYYVIGGGASLAAVPLIAKLGEVGAIALPGALPGAIVWQVFATSGFMGGFVYWMVAGRRA